MTIRYIPTEYRKPAMSTMGFFMQNLQPLLQMYVQHSMQKDLLDKQIGVDKTRVTAANKEWDRRFGKQQGAKGMSLAKTLYDKYGVIQAGKGFAKFDKKTGDIRMLSIPEADNIKNKQISTWIADKTLIPVDAKYSAGAPTFKFQDRNYYFNPKEKIEEPYKIGHIKPFKVGDDYIDRKYLGKGKWEDVGKAPRYRMGVTIQNIIGQEKFGIRKGQTAGGIRLELMQNKIDKDLYESTAITFNNTNAKNEVAYWTSEPGKLYGKNEFTKIIKLPGSSIKKGLTPKEIQDRANMSGKTVRQVLQDLGIIK